MIKWKSRKFHNFAFTLHRYIGFTIGLPIVLIGLTGSLLVFKPEIEQLLITQKFGYIEPQAQMISIDTVLATAKSELVSRPELKIYSIRLPPKPSSPYQVDLFDNNDQFTRLFIHSYTGKVMGWMSDSTIERIILKLHYGLLSGLAGEIVVGIIGLFLFILSITGLILWTGWRNLISGFKIKWNGHLRRVNFDIHKVTGIFTTLLLSMTAFTGFCWNFSDLSYPIIYAATFTRPLPELTSTPIPNQEPLPISKLLENSNTVFPGAKTFSMTIPEKATDVVSIRKRQRHETLFYGQSDLLIDSYSGKILRVVDSKKMPLGDSIIASFEPLHYGTFWGFSSRILYIFVGLSPLILLITSLIMFRYPKNKKIIKVTSDSVTTIS
jgi:uncharacterized iron-regulated membrane protein